MQIQVKRFQLLVYCLFSLACHQISTRSASPAPPVTSYRMASIDLLVAGAPQTLRGAFVTPQFIKVAREQPVRGRYFLDEEYRDKGGQVVVLGYNLWQERFGADPTIIGRKVELNGQTYTVVGVMPRGYNIPEGVEVWLPDAKTGG
jgi:hypothetical protein